jgi:uncharacterized membrane protein
MASIGTKIKEAAMKAAKEKVFGDAKKGNKDERTGGAESGMDKAMRAVKNRLK